MLFVIFVVTVSIVTIAIALWNANIFEESDCAKRGGTWVAVRKQCVVE